MNETYVHDTIEAIKNVCYNISELETRDIFAMSALTAIAGTDWGRSISNDKLAASAYSIADEMIKARKKRS